MKINYRILEDKLKTNFKIKLFDKIFDIKALIKIITTKNWNFWEIVFWHLSFQKNSQKYIQMKRKEFQIRNLHHQLIKRHVQKLQKQQGYKIYSTFDTKKINKIEDKVLSDSLKH